MRWAARQGHLEVTSILVQKGANLNLADNYGNTPLILAAFNGNAEVVKRLLQAGVDKAAKDKNYGKTALDWARQQKHAAVVALLE